MKYDIHTHNETMFGVEPEKLSLHLSLCFASFCPTVVVFAREGGVVATVHIFTGTFSTDEDGTPIWDVKPLTPDASFDMPPTEEHRAHLLEQVAEGAALGRKTRGEKLH